MKTYQVLLNNGKIFKVQAEGMSTKADAEVVVFETKTGAAAVFPLSAVLAAWNVEHAEQSN